MINSDVTVDCMISLEKMLVNSTKKIISLNFAYCYLDGKCIYHLARGLSVNRTLVSLNLSSNGLNDHSGVVIIQSLAHNIHLTTLDLSKNNLGDEFAHALCITLTKNETLWKIDLSNNPINYAGAEMILKVLKESNDNLVSLGDIEANFSMGVLTVRNINISLTTNRENADLQVREPKDKDKDSHEPVDLMSRLMLKDSGKDSKNQTDYGNYQILKPLAYVNNPLKTIGDFKMWNI